MINTWLIDAFDLKSGLFHNLHNSFLKLKAWVSKLFEKFHGISASHRGFNFRSWIFVDKANDGA